MRRGVLLLPDGYSLWKRWEIFVRDNFRNRNQDVGMVAARRNGPAAGWSKAQGASQETMYALGLERTKVLRKVLSPLLTCWAKVECFFTTMTTRRRGSDAAACWMANDRRWLCWTTNKFSARLEWGAVLTICHWRDGSFFFGDGVLLSSWLKVLNKVDNSISDASNLTKAVKKYARKVSIIVINPSGCASL